MLAWDEGEPQDGELCQQDFPGVSRAPSWSGYGGELGKPQVSSIAVTK